MSSEPTPDPYSPEWIDGPHRPEDSEYVLEQARRYRQELAGEQAQEIADKHREAIDELLDRMRRLTEGGV